MRSARSLVLVICLACPFLSACKDGGGGGASCDKVVDHVLSLMPEDAKKDADKKELIGKCEKEATDAERKCVLEAKTMDALMACEK